MKFILTQLLFVAGLKLTVHTGSPVEKVVELIAELQGYIAEANDAMAQATKIREKKNSDYQQEKAYMETTLTSLHQAIEVLNHAGTKGGVGFLRVVSRVRSALLDSPRLDMLSEEKARLLKSFFEDPLSLLQDPVDYYDQKAQAKASYSPQSATVMGILKDMYDTFSADLEKSNQEESAAQKNFEDLIAEKQKQIKDWTAEMTDKEGQKAEKETMLSEASELLSATQA